MGIQFNQQDYIGVKEIPTARKFQRLIRYINDHILRRGSLSQRDPAPYQHNVEAIKWDDGLGGGKSIYDKMLEHRGEIVEPNDRMAMVVISHQPDTSGSRTAYLDRYQYICDGTNDETIIQRALNVVYNDTVSGRRGKIFLKRGTYSISSQLTIVGNGLIIEGEPGTILESQMTGNMFQVYIRNNLINPSIVEFRNITFRGSDSSGATLVRVIFEITTANPGLGKIIFNKCVFDCDKQGYALHISSASGFSQDSSVLEIRDCYFKKSSAHYKVQCILVESLRKVDIIRSAFYDVVTAQWNRAGYDPAGDGVGRQPAASFIKCTMDGVPSIGSSDMSVISGPLIKTTSCETVTIKDCDFKHCDTAIYSIGKGVSTSNLFVNGSCFYQMSCFRTPVDNTNTSSPDRACIINHVSNTGVIHNNVLLARRSLQSSATTAMGMEDVWNKQTSQVDGTTCFIYNVSNGVSTINTGFSQKEFSVVYAPYSHPNTVGATSSDHRSLRTFRKHNTDRDVPLNKRGI